MIGIDNYKIVTKSLFCSVFLYFVLLVVAMPTLLEAELGQFRLLSNVIKEQKKTVYLLGLLTESVLGDDDYVADDLKTKTQVSKLSVYKLNEMDPITEQELKVISSATKAIESMPELASDVDYFLYYRSYDGKKAFTARAFSDFTLTDSFFTSRCELHMTCSPYATLFSLSDRIMISPIYTDMFTGRRIITVSTPAYEKGRIVGDIAMDIYLDKYTFLNGKQVVREDDGITITSIIKDNSLILSDFSYFEEYVTDNRNILIYKVSLFQFALHYFWIFIVLWFFSGYMFWRLEELKLKKHHLKNAEVKVVRDELTGLYNRSILKQSHFIAAVKKHGAAVIAIDGNKIKSVNDEYGHHIGDVAIKHIADGMSATFRDSDFLIRTGGDEFLAFLIGCSQEKAENLASEFNTNIKSTPFSHYALTVSVSFGITVVSNREPLDNAIKRADSLLYANKKEH